MNQIFEAGIEDSDPDVFAALEGEKHRQQNQLELIASENIVSRAVRETLGHEITNKTLEGYPGNRFHGGADFVDILEQLAIDRARQLFNCDYVNVQPHSGTQANQAVFFSLLQPGDRILSLDLAAGGHLSHGARPNLSGKWFDANYYYVDRESGCIDYDALYQQALELKPKLVIAGGSAYPRQIDFPRMSEIAGNCGAKLLVDMAHFAGLVAAGVHPSPIPHADIVTCTTTKTLRGPRGGLILCKDDTWASKLQSAVFPGVQGSMHTQVIAAKTVCLGEALTADYRVYAQRVVDNARALAARLSRHGIDLVSGGTDTHLVLLDLRNRNISGQQAQDRLFDVNITSNKNPVPFDSGNPSRWVGLRLGVAAATTRGLGKEEFADIADIINTLLVAGDPVNSSLLEGAKMRIAELCTQFPVDTDL